VDHVQGYLISRPLDIVRFARFLGAQRAEPVPAMRLVA
jgi:EAL domain-containing protein (putative c-di-GMP-specific phosphodiesterase class I)